MRTYVPKRGEVQCDWWVVDAQGKTLGRMATEIASRIRGKHKPGFTPFLDTGDHVIVVNAEKVVLTGNKLQNKYYRKQTVKKLELMIEVAQRPSVTIIEALELQRKLLKITGTQMAEVLGISKVHYSMMINGKEDAKLPRKAYGRAFIIGVPYKVLLFDEASFPHANQTESSPPAGEPEGV